MAFSTKEQYRNNVHGVLDKTPDDDTIVNDRIAEADKQLKVDLINYIPQTWTSLTDITDEGTKNVISKLSQYKTCELCIMYAYTKRGTSEDEVIDYKEWKAKYDDLINKIKSGDIILIVNSVVVNAVSPSLVSRTTSIFGTERYGGVSDAD